MYFEELLRNFLRSCRQNIQRQVFHAFDHSTRFIELQHLVWISRSQFNLLAVAHEDVAHPVRFLKELCCDFLWTVRMEHSLILLKCGMRRACESCNNNWSYSISNLTAHAAMTACGYWSVAYTPQGSSLITVFESEKILTIRYRFLKFARLDSSRVGHLSEHDKSASRSRPLVM